VLEDKDMELEELRVELSEKMGLLNMSGDEQLKLESLVKQKQSRIE
jgi:hypothetical protein